LEESGIITWTGMVEMGQPVTITYGVTVCTGISGPTAILNAALINDGEGQVWERTATVVINARAVYLPLIRK